MPMTLDEIGEETRQLPPDVVAGISGPHFTGSPREASSRM
jgi:hypothetical protein